MSRSGLLLVVSLLAACHRGEASPAEGTASSAAIPSAGASANVPAGAASAAGVDFTGRYDSTEGPATITQRGFDVTIHYKSGRADCDAAGSSLSCTWHEGTDYGAARLARVAGGKLVGTWGVGKSSTSGGEWVFVPAK